ADRSGARSPHASGVRARFRANPPTPRGLERRRAGPLARSSAPNRDRCGHGAESAVSYRAQVVLETVEAPGERFAVRFGSGAVVPVDNVSTPAAASPVEMVLVALGGCSAVDVIQILRKKRQGGLGYEGEGAGARGRGDPR